MGRGLAEQERTAKNKVGFMYMLAGGTNDSGNMFRATLEKPKSGLVVCALHLLVAAPADQRILFSPRRKNVL
jgi:hypothetical protein